MRDTFDCKRDGWGFDYPLGKMIQNKKPTKATGLAPLRRFTPV